MHDTVKIIRVSFVRVGSAFYDQKKATLETANDLNEIGFRQMDNAARNIAYETRRNEKFRIYTSASPRALHGSKYILKRLMDENVLCGRILDGKSCEKTDIIKPLQLLNEIENFDPVVFRFLIHGYPERVGEKTIINNVEARIKIKGNRSISNPENLDPETGIRKELNQTEYIKNRYWEHVNLNKLGLAKDLQESLKKMESLEGIKKRAEQIKIWLMVESLLGLIPKHYVIVSHLTILQALLGKDNINPGECITKTFKYTS